MHLFVRLADLGSFTKVADAQNSSKSLVSKEISRLEATLGARLIHRSTRNLQLTPVGEGYLQRCRALLLQLEDAEAYVQDQQTQPRGRLKINAPMALGLTDLSRAFSAFMQAYPQLELDIHLGDESLDLVEHGFDLGLRASSRPFDSSFVGKPLTCFSYKVCAAPTYLLRHPPITEVQHLQRHNGFLYSYFKGKHIWPLEGGIAIQGTLRVNSTLFMKQLVLDGLGIGLLPDFVCHQELASGQLVEVLPQAARPQLTLYALYPARQFVPPKLLHCIAFMQDWFNPT
ncbi:MAG: LysR family transcriptional regulator [Pseudomonas sp.]|uniref:LysR family transcriptional regulator n=1 Tax=Pseudomonas sp. TaxID=306 RepID=UPI003390C4B8